MVTFTNRKTKTWKGRHENKISEFISTLKLWKIKDPTVIQLGPGGISVTHASLFPEGPEDKMPFADRKKLQLTSVLESRARDKKDAHLITFETQELYSALQSSVGLSRLYVVDNEPKVLEAVVRLNLEDVEVIEHDIRNGIIKSLGQRLQADAGIAYKTFEYLGSRYYSAIASYMGSFRDNAILSLTFHKNKEHLSLGLTKVGDTVYLKGERPDKRHGLSLPRPVIDEKLIVEAANRASPGPIRAIASNIDE